MKRVLAILLLVPFIMVLAPPCLAAGNGEVTVSLVDIPAELQERSVLVTLGNGPNDTDTVLVVLTLTDTKNPDAELCTPSRDENTTVQRAAAYNAPAAAAPSATPTPEPTSSQPVQQSKKSVNPFWNVLDFLPIVFIGAGLFWFRRKNRRGGPKG